MFGIERGSRLSISPSNTIHIDQIAPLEHSPRNTRKQIAIHVALHRGAHSAKVIARRFDGHILHAARSQRLS